MVNEVAQQSRKRAVRMSPEERKAQILEAAIRAVAKNGILNTTHKHVSEEANVARPTVFHYFPTIEQLQLDVIREVRRFLLDDFVLARSHLDISASDRISDMLHTFAAAMYDNINIVIIWLEWSGLTRGEFWQLYLEFYNDTVKAIQSLLLEGRKDNSVCKEVDATDAARLILATAHAIAHLHFSGASQRTIAKTINTLVRRLVAPVK